MAAHARLNPISANPIRFTFFSLTGVPLDLAIPNAKVKLA
jgi:hypothetical protein